MARIAQYTEPLTVVFSPDTYQHIKELSDAQNISMGEILRQMVNRSIEGSRETRKLSEAMEDLRQRIYVDQTISSYRGRMDAIETSQWFWQTVGGRPDILLIWSEMSPTFAKPLRGVCKSSNL